MLRRPYMCLSLSTFKSNNWKSVPLVVFIRNRLPKTRIQVCFWCFYALKSP